MRVLLLALALTAIASSADAEAYGLKAARAALSGKSQAVIVSVPDAFVHAKPGADPKEATQAGDWSFYFTDWLKIHGDRSNVVVVTPAELRRLIRTPDLAGDCTTVWVREPGRALVYDASCAPKAEVYAAGDSWVVSGGPPTGPFRAVDIVLR
jgi:hypothetical protein